MSFQIIKAGAGTPVGPSSEAGGTGGVGSKAQTLAARLIEYLSGLVLSGGDHDGEAFEVLNWEKRLIRGAFSTPGDFAMSLARGNGKSAVVAGLACAVADPDGPLHGTRAEVDCVASSFSQGRIIFEDCLSFLRAKNGLDRKGWRVQDSANSALIEHRESGARIRCLGSDPKRAHGLRPSLVLADEPAQWEPAKAGPMIAALRTSLGKVHSSRLIALGTRPLGETHWFAKMLKGERSLSYYARPDDPPFHLKTIRRANPSFDHLPSLRETLKREAEEARGDPAMLAAWRALRLNQGTSDVLRAELLSAGTWERIEGDHEADGPYCLGIDLGGGGETCAMSAAVAYWPLTARLEALAFLPGVPGLAQRGLSDGVGRLYLDMAQRGELLTTPGRTVPEGALLAEIERRWGHPASIAADRWREAELRQALDDARFPACTFSARGMGFHDGGEDVRLFRRACLAGRVAPLPSLLMRSAMSEAVVLADPAGNEKLSKGSEGARRVRAKDDAVAAAILAVAEGERRGAEAPRMPGILAVV